MTKKFRIYIISSLIITVSVTSLCYGFQIGLPSVIKKQAEEMNEEAKEKKAEEEAEDESLYDVANDEWKIIDDEIVIVGTGGGDYLMWPRGLSNKATNNNAIIKWANANTYPAPTWDADEKAYEYPPGYDKYDYPIFAWVEGLKYAGYDDWRLPTKSELLQLYYDGKDNIIYFQAAHWSGEEVQADTVYWVNFADGSSGHYYKITPYRVRAVRDGSKSE
ncbi:DUF1566 domain-containing protein [Elusimicrobiota bacterium]